MAVFERLAPAKVNLFLHVGPRGADGYHPICSLMTFADVGDELALDTKAPHELVVTGPFGGALSSGPDNLVMRARDAVQAAFDLTDDTFRITLDKRLPVASGLGGGSSDAAAALLLIAEAMDIHYLDGGWDEADWEAIWDIAAELGADTFACLYGEPRLATGRGDILDFPPTFPDLDVVLVNPGAPSPTAAVYRAYDDFGAPGGADTPEFPAPLETAEATAAWLARQRNDLEGPAISLAPEIGETLRLLKAQPETLLARMSGSGATCFALCRDRRDAETLALQLASSRDGWWVKPCRLKGFHP